MAESPSYRLPRSVRPERYELDITPDLNAARFFGQARIAVTVDEPVSTFELNAAELEVDEVELVLADGVVVPGSPTFEREEERVRLDWGRIVPAGGATIRLRFAGILNDRLRGFYRSTYRDTEGKTQVIASTQCEASDCRRIFPCWDEPDFKAVFALSLTVDSDLTAHSNGPVKSVEDLGDGKKRVTFGETMKMSSYLVAMSVGPFAETSPVSVDGTPIRIVAPADRMPLTGWAENCAAHSLHFFAQYFGIPYPGEKLDHIAIPDFAFGAMENLGLVTYREVALLVDRDHASQAELRGVQGVIAHETAHMWFGDLVTMRWWNGVWLNEAFATFMQMLCSDDFSPAWDVWTAFGVARARALATDSTAAARPIEPPPGPLSDALDVLDELTYSKGASVLRQMEQYLGPDVFRSGIRLYLDRHRYGNTEASDLWDALEDASGEPVRAIMDAWVSQGGHPLVTADLSTDGRHLHVSQEHFRYADTGDGRLWPVPVTAEVHGRDGSVESVRLLLTDATAELALSTEVEWVLINPGASGFYRVRYAGVLWERLVAHFGELDPRDRLAVLVDVWALVVAGRTPLATAASAWRNLSHESNPDVWAAVAGPLGLLYKIAADTELSAIRALVQDMAGPVYAQAGFDPREGEDEGVGRLRAQVVRLLGTLGADAQVQEVCQDRFRAYRAGSGTLAGDMLPAVVAVVAASGGEAEWNLLDEARRAADTPQAEVRYLAALGGFSDPLLIGRALTLYQSDDVRTQDAPFLIARVLASRTGQYLAWDAIEQHWDTMVARFPVTTLAGLVEPIAEVVDEVLGRRLRTFLDAHPIPYAHRQLEQASETQAVNLGLAERVRGRLARELGFE